MGYTGLWARYTTMQRTTAMDFVARHTGLPAVVSHSLTVLSVEQVAMRSGINALRVAHCEVSLNCTMGHCVWNGTGTTHHTETDDAADGCATSWNTGLEALRAS